MTENEHIHKVLAVIVRATEASQAKWIVGGSAGLMLRGLPLAAEPRDLDIYCDEEEVQAIYQALQDYACDEPTISTTSMYRSTLCHFRIHDMQVELVGGFQVTALGCQYVTEVKSLLIPYSESINIKGTNLSAYVVPLAHELWFNQLRERDDRVQLITQAISSEASLHEEALQAIEFRNGFTEEAKEGIHRKITKSEAGGFK
ncbi:hypothetical protein L1N85_04005 [Paenibacillus alkaliterrae]|uniref:nucleotidyltransferase domain-containing protein n=1 Tax=Paenibacillus alkaliterrae TaxID=320909 RepID=UPI001F260E41|nr:hypothetical protein [Paenibacillus alkaliterrae]MCF2937596.1 hypothetical protein [Paenibacillus alkaliterrae]